MSVGPHSTLLLGCQKKRKRIDEEKEEKGKVERGERTSDFRKLSHRFSLNYSSCNPEEEERIDEEEDRKEEEEKRKKTKAKTKKDKRAKKEREASMSFSSPLTTFCMRRQCLKERTRGKQSKHKQKEKKGNDKAWARRTDRKEHALTGKFRIHCHCKIEKRLDNDKKSVWPVSLFRLGL